jgi:hypothetical protein
MKKNVPALSNTVARQTDPLVSERISGFKSFAEDLFTFS